MTYIATAEKILKALQDVKDEAFKLDSTKEIDLVEDMASHDTAIKRFKNYKATTSKWDDDWIPDKKDRSSGRPNGSGGSRGPRGPYKKTQNR